MSVVQTVVASALRPIATTERTEPGDAGGTILMLIQARSEL
jgi:hypothetical protein